VTKGKCKNIAEMITNEKEILEFLLDYFGEHKGHIAKVRFKTLARLLLKRKKVERTELYTNCLSRYINYVFDKYLNDKKDVFISDGVVLVGNIRRALIKVLTEYF